MFLKKVTKIQNVGKFSKGRVSGGEYGKYTLFYAGNGRGKSTICAILRSMKTNDPTILMERRTLGTTGSPEIQLLLDSGPATFTGGVWRNSETFLHVFDGDFVTANVHVGEEVSTENRRSLYRVIVGAKGVQLAETINELDARSTEITGKIALEKKAIQQHVPNGMNFEHFLGLAEIPEIEEKIVELKKKMAAALQGAEIAAKPLLSPVTVPTLPSEFLPTVTTTVAGISKDALRKVTDHLNKHKWSGEGERWIATGLPHIIDNKCPFCDNSLEANVLIATYHQYFDQSYSALKIKLAGLQELLLQSISEAEGLRTKARFEELTKAVQYWRTFGKVTFDDIPDLDDVASKLAALHAETMKALEAKISSPLDHVDLGALSSAISDWQTTADGLQACNESLVTANIEIKAIKNATATEHKAILEASLRELEATKVRHSPQVKSLIHKYEALLGEKRDVVAEKEGKKEELDAYDVSMLAKCHDAINEYLKLFGTGFRLLKSEKTYQGKIPQWVYTIEVNKHPVDVTKKAGSGEPSFQSVLSTGDRSTLALALFLAQLDLDQELANSVVVFDDPFSSLDDFRREMTSRTIFRVGQTASQVIVFSHDKYFLKTVANAVSGARCETFQISATPINSCIEEWDLDREVKDGYLAAHMDMLDFHDGRAGTVSEMRLKMRPLLENYIRYRFPNQIPDGKWLGDMLAIIRGDPNHPLYSAYSDIDDINSFTAPFHHDASAPFNEDEVRTYVARTLAIVGGC